ncbi:hypothetical protein HMPREF0293_2199 [Corynebacterium glucuronolyticum ATCC 51866]|uniref:Uncharacterized protein n=1 Tax=Corynebacterium glucuronolyticum ATCC 51866 TaxID=548478 RepID=A0ABP2DQL7_9CORY|nr:hypothetical protein HMPREF0293_2199 [Corynebacterium glucuronolyticum ATCC 51866]
MKPFDISGRKIENHVFLFYTCWRSAPRHEIKLQINPSKHFSP